MEVSLDEEAAAEFVKLKRDPHRFTKALFDGDWAWPGRHPSVGEPIRLLRIMSGNDGVARIIARQGPMLFATPWITP